MRITKVKVNKQDVRIERNADEAFLKIGEVEYKGSDKIKEFLKDQKQNNFKASFLNITLIKDIPKLDNKKSYQNKDALKDINAAFNEIKYVFACIIQDALKSKYSNFNNYANRLDLNYNKIKNFNFKTAPKNLLDLILKDKFID